MQALTSVAAVDCAGAANVAECLRNVPSLTVLSAAGGGFTDAGTGTVAPTLNAKVLPNGAYHVAAWFVFPTPCLDANQMVLQQQEVADLTTFGRTGNPTAEFTPTWPEFNDSIWNKISPKP